MEGRGTLLRMLASTDKNAPGGDEADRNTPGGDEADSLRRAYLRRRFLRRSLAAGAALSLPTGLAGCAHDGRPRAALPDAASLGLRQQIAQMLLIGFRAFALSGDEPVVRDVRDLGIGGVILFDWDDVLKAYERDIASPEQVADLTTALQSYAAIPLLVAIDQEGGRVSRLKERYGFQASVSAQSLGTTNDLTRTRLFAESTAATLRVEGINVNLAPVVDLNVNPGNPVIGKLERSYSLDPDIVCAHARQVIAAHDGNGVATCLKHFPGHGSSTTDSHLGFTDVTPTWSERELLPYRTLIGEDRCRMVMTAHIYNRRLDPEYPATLSHATITGLLRERLGFDGVVVSDDLQMGAIRQHFAFDTAIEKCILAGVDLLDICNEAVYDPDAAPKTIDLVERAVRDGRISRLRIEASCRRILRLKAWLASRAAVRVAARSAPIDARPV